MTFTFHYRGVTVTVSVPALALPNGTMVNIAPASTDLASDLPRGQSYVTAFELTWVAPDGNSPAASAPISITIAGPSIKSGDVIYLLGAHGLHTLAAAAENGKLATSFTTDVEFVVAGVPRLTGAAPAAVLGPTSVRVKLTCGPAANCTGTAVLSVKTGVGAKAQVLGLAHGGFVIAAGSAKTVSLTESVRGAKFLKEHQDLEGQLSITLVGGPKSTHAVVVP